MSLCRRGHHRLGQAGAPERAVQRLAFQPCGHLRAQRDQPVEILARSRCPCWRACRPGLRSRRCRWRRAHAGSRRCRRGRHRSGVMPICQRGVDVGQAQAARVVEVAAVEPVAGHRQAQLEQRRAPSPDRRSPPCRPGPRGRRRRRAPPAPGAALRRARRGPGSCSRRRCSCRPRSACASRAHRAARGCAAMSATTSSGVLRRLARLCAWLADSGSSISSASPSMRALGALEVGHQHRSLQAGQGLAQMPAPRQCRPAAAAAAPARRSRPRSRAGRPRTPRESIPACARWARCVAMLCRPSRRPTSRMMAWRAGRVVALVRVTFVSMICFPTA